MFKSIIYGVKNHKVINKYFIQNIKHIILNIRVLIYRNSKYSKELTTFKDKHKGERCFIIGNGPSLRAEDLEMLKNEITFAANRIYEIFPKINWRPTYYCVQDFVLINQIKEEIKKVECKEKFIAINSKWIYKFKIDNCRYFYLNTENYDTIPKFSKDISKEVFEGYTITYGMIQLAKYLGFKEIYLIGVDHSYSKVVDNEGNITYNNEVKDYFIGDSNWNIFNLPNLDKSTAAYLSAEKFARNNGIKIFNATRGGKLEVFKRVDLNEILD